MHTTLVRFVLKKQQQRLKPWITKKITMGHIEVCGCGMKKMWVWVLLQRLSKQSEKCSTGVKLPSETCLIDMFNGPSKLCSTTVLTSFMQVLLWVCRALPLCRRQRSGPHPCTSRSQHRLESRQPDTPSPRKARPQPGNYTESQSKAWCCELCPLCSLLLHRKCYLSTKLTMLGFFSSFMTRISLMISSFFGCFCRLICLMATCKSQRLVNVTRLAFWFWLKVRQLHILRSRVASTFFTELLLDKVKYRIRRGGENQESLCLGRDKTRQANLLSCGNIYGCVNCTRGPERKRNQNVNQKSSIVFVPFGMYRSSQRFTPTHHRHQSCQFWPFHLNYIFKGVRLSSCN